jgi:hypothetical protein
MLDVVECDDIKHGCATMYALLLGAGKEGEGMFTPIVPLVEGHRLLTR